VTLRELRLMSSIFTIQSYRALTTFHKVKTIPHRVGIATDRVPFKDRAGWFRHRTSRASALLRRN
jgi:hypothetical protein